MSNRFAKKKRNFDMLKSLVLPVLCFAAAAAMFVWGLDGLTKKTQAEQLSSVQNAITRAAVQCYAVEGQYPTGIDYLRDHYGLAVDLDRYIVEYRAFASNIMPTITVLPKNFAGQSVSSAFPDDLTADSFQILGSVELPAGN